MEPCLNWWWEICFLNDAVLVVLSSITTFRRRGRLQRLRPVYISRASMCVGGGGQRAKLHPLVSISVRPPRACFCVRYLVALRSLLGSTNYLMVFFAFTHRLDRCCSRHITSHPGGGVRVRGCEHQRQGQAGPETSDQRQDHPDEGVHCPPCS